jgi:hypothetical protein
MGDNGQDLINTFMGRSFAWDTGSWMGCVCVGAGMPPCGQLRTVSNTEALAVKTGKGGGEVPSEMWTDMPFGM